MASNTRFAVAIHTAGMLASTKCLPVSSEIIARSVHTNPVVVRRIIGLLARHGLVNVRKGQGGGATLSRPAEQITLDEIYRAVEDGPVFNVPTLRASHPCKMGRHVGPVLHSIFATAESGLMDHLRTITLAQVIRTIVREMKQEECGSK
ncbi:MAG: Rrf2 family transcriptional regulator [Bryobacteraceae bacterium]